MAARMSRDVYKAAVEGEVNIIMERIEHLDNQVTPNGNTVLHIYIMGGRPSEECVSTMVERFPSLLWKKNKKDETALHMAAKEGLTQIARTLLDQVNPLDLESGNQQLGVKEMVEMRNDEGDTALHEAVRYRRLDCVKLLIRAAGGGRLNCANAAGETPLYMAVKRGFDELVDEILETCRSPADFDGPKGLTVLHQAVICSKGEIARKILQKMPNLATKIDEKRWTPLHYATYCGKVSLAEELLRRAESAAYMRDSDGVIPLHIAASRNQVQIMEKLISYCPDAIELVDNNRRNILHLAMQTRSRTAMLLILRNSWGNNLVNDKDVNGDTPLHMFADSMFGSSLFLVPTLILSHQRVDIMIMNNQGLTVADILSSTTRGLFVADILSSTTRGSTTFLVNILPLCRGNLLVKGCVELLLDLVDAILTRLNATKDNIGDATPTRLNIGATDKASEIKEASEIKKASKIHLIVATLIATVAYAAGFSLPGGYSEDEKGSHRGMPVLVKKASFVAFYITVGLAMLLSTVAVMIYLFMTLEKDLRHLRSMFTLALYSTLISMGAMLTAFVMAACAVLFNFNGTLIIVVAVILPFIFCVIDTLSFIPLAKIAKLVVNHLQNWPQLLGLPCLTDVSVISHSL